MSGTSWEGVVLLLIGIGILLLGGWELGVFDKPPFYRRSDIGFWDGSFHCLFVGDYCVGVVKKSMYIDIPFLRYPALGAGLMFHYLGIKTLITGNDA
jgi:steroid 5-alpha reductase family enzyme